ncbi:transposable element Tcb1 transposase [Trichonephila clavipes]|nr:transposable element Tcb1 transposase [Trichonephila clavipes]
MVKKLRLALLSSFEMGLSGQVLSSSLDSGSELRIISRRKQRSAFDQVSEFDRGTIVAYRDCGLSFGEIGSRVGRNQTTVMRICYRWMQEGTTDRRGRSHPPQCTTSREEWQIVRMTVTHLSVTSRTIAQHIESATHHSVYAPTI